MGLTNLVLVGAILMGQAGAAQVDPLRDQVRNLARQLGDDALEVREKAEQELLELGVDVLAHLPVENSRMPAEMRQRIGRVRQRLEVQRAEMAADGSRVTLAVKEQPLSLVLRKIEEQTGNQFVDFRDFRGQRKTDPKITVEIEDVPFWQAVDMVFQKAGVTTYPHAIDDDGEPLRNVAFVAQPAGGSPRDKYACYEGPFRFQPRNIVARRDLVEPTASGLEMEVEVSWEPRLAPILLAIKGDSVRAMDNDGQPIGLRMAGERAIDVYGSTSTFPLLLQLPERGAKSIKQLQGNLAGLVAGRVETFNFEKLNVAKNRQQKKAGATVKVTGVHKHRRQIAEDPDLQFDGEVDADVDVWQINVRVKLEISAGLLESHLMNWVLENEAYLIDADGNKVEPDTIEKNHEADDEFGVGLLFGLAGGIEGYQFVYKTPAGLLNKEIPFKFNEIDLP